MLHNMAGHMPDARLNVRLGTRGAQRSADCAFALRFESGPFGVTAVVTAAPRSLPSRNVASAASFVATVPSRLNVCFSL